MRFMIPFLVLLGLTVRSAAEQLEVDLELVLMADVSRSMTERELEIQRRGYAEALRSGDVLAAIQRGFLQRIALTYVEWAGYQEVIVDWRLIETQDDLDDFADALTARFDPSLRRTSISGALLMGADMLRDNEYAGFRQVIDISGDGPNNQGRPVLHARNAVVAQGIVINGLPLMTREGLGLAWHLDDLDIYFRTCVIGGFGAFVLPVTDWQDFAAAVRRKLVLEIGGDMPPPVVHAQSGDLARDPTDCLIGEKIWQQRGNGFVIP
ncbi:DUF1194 domain-containing protein [Yoonia sp. 2307UL14-13]|uniref:DUF1194 domain-containing protein n=1 Tax=Yoonia sp. 2307UL14-13 TaxID=3126506 RepID=UPI003095EAAE